LLAAEVEIDARSLIDQYQCKCLLCLIYSEYIALHLAATRNYISIIKTLYSAGASLSELIDSDETTLSLAEALGYTEIVEVLLAAEVAQTKVSLIVVEVKSEMNYRRRAMLTSFS
jgi:hypothetical protein